MKLTSSPRSVVQKESAIGGRTVSSGKPSRSSHQRERECEVELTDVEEEEEEEEEEQQQEEEEARRRRAVGRSIVLRFSRRETEMMGNTEPMAARG